MRLRLLPLGVAIGLLAVPLLPALSAEAQESSIPVVIKLRYPDGTGTPDAEGVSAAPGGVIYVATERNNDASSTSRPSVLRFELGAPGELTATHEWNLAEIIGTVGANGGLEAVEWISDEDAVALGLTDSSGVAYDPTGFGPHGGGVFVVGVEGTGNLHVLVLEDDGSITQLQQHASGFQGVMALDFDTESQLLWVVCDEVCGGQSATWSVVDGQFAALVVHERPTGLGNFANEGFALGACRTDQTKIVVWGDDAETDGISLRQGTLGCTLHEEPTEPPVTPEEPTEPAPTDPATPGTPTESPSPVAPEAPQPGGTDRPGKLPATGAPVAIGALAAGVAAIAVGGTMLARRR